MLDSLHKTVAFSVDLFAVIALFLFIAAVLWVIVLYIIDVNNKNQTIRRNYPVIGRFRYIFEHFGEFFRQYFFSQDREELPFNRAQRTWVYRASKNIPSNSAFGSTKDIKTPGSYYFVNCLFPTLSTDSMNTRSITFGSNITHPYSTDKLFYISAMSFGALSSVAVEALSKGAKKAGILMNTGEGGISSYHISGNCDLIFQIGSAKYGVRDDSGNLSEKKIKEVANIEQVKMFEIKLSQGAKPGKGGILPAAKVTKEIAKIRCIPEGKSSISPNRHIEIEKESDILDLIAKIRNLTQKPVGFKAVMGSYEWLHILCQEIVERGLDSAPDFITIDGSEGGTGAAPTSLLDNMGISIRESLPLVVDILKKYGLKNRVKVVASGKLITSSDIVWALCAGADIVASARGFMFSLGCIQAMQCNKNTCPAGIATQNKKLQRGLVPKNKAERVAHYANNIHKEISIIAHSCGIKDPREFNRSHVRIVTETTRSVGMHEVYPDVTN